MKVTKTVGEIVTEFEGSVEEYKAFIEIDKEDIPAKPVVDKNDPSTWPVFKAGDRVKYVRGGVPLHWTSDWALRNGLRIGDEVVVEDVDIDYFGTRHFLVDGLSSNMPTYHFDLVK